MTPDQQRFLLATYGPDWTTADLLLSDDAIKPAKESLRGGCIEWEGERTYYQTTNAGIGLGHLHSGVTVLIPWRAFGQHRRTVPSAVLEQLRAAREAHRNGARYPVFHLPPDIAARRVGPSQDIHPDDRDALAAARDRWLREDLAAWRAEAQALDARLADAVRACLPAADLTEPLDLLDHLAAMGAPQ